MVVGTHRGLVENLSLSLCFGGADVPLVQKTGATVNAVDFFSDAFVWGFDVAYGGEIGGGDKSWEAGIKFEQIYGQYNAAANKLNDKRFSLYGNLAGWPLDTTYLGVRFPLVSATYTVPGPNAILSQAVPFGIVIGIREKADRFSYSMELGLIDSWSFSVGAGVSF